MITVVFTNILAIFNITFPPVLYKRYIWINNSLQSADNFMETMSLLCVTLQIPSRDRIALWCSLEECKVFICQQYHGPLQKY